MSAPSAIRVWFANLLMTLGLLVGGLSGLCTGLFVPIFLLNPASGPFGEPFGALMIGGPFMSLGGAVFLVGRSLTERPRPWLGWAALALALIIIANGAAILLYREPGSDMAGARGAALLDVIPGLILAVTGLFELRRKPSQSRVGPPG